VLPVAAPSFSERRHRDALAGLRRINRFSGTGNVAWRAIEVLAASDPQLYGDVYARAG